MPTRARSQYSEAPRPAGPVDAVVLAGGRISGAFARAAGTRVKALAPVGGAPLLSRLAAALRETPELGRVLVVGPEELRSALPDRVDWVPERRSGPDNVLAGLEALPPETGHVLLCASDLPTLTPDALSDFLRRAPLEADAVMPLVRYEAVRERFPGEVGYALRFREGRLTSGGMVLVRPDALLARLELARALFERRKNPLAMAAVLGWPFLRRLLTGRLSVHEVADRLSEMTGLRCAAVPECRPELAFDVDTLLDLRYANRVLFDPRRPESRCP